MSTLIQVSPVTPETAVPPLRGLHPFFSYFGSKYLLAKLYPKPVYDTIIEPFAGSAGYSLLYPEKNVILYDAYEPIYSLWRYLIDVSVRDILALPLGPFDREHPVDDRLPREAQLLLGFWLSESQTSASRYPQSKSRKGNWTEAKRARIAEQLQYIRHWKVHFQTYSGVEHTWGNRHATWFVDPPYHQAGSRYLSSRVDYPDLAQWCKTRNGQVIVCEQDPAAWLPFQPLHRHSNGSNKQYHEVVWSRMSTEEPKGAPPTMSTQHVPPPDATVAPKPTTAPNCPMIHDRGPVVEHVAPAAPVAPQDEVMVKHHNLSRRTFTDSDFHPTASIFPLMNDADLQELAEDIKANGLQSPIELFEWVGLRPNRGGTGGYELKDWEGKNPDSDAQTKTVMSNIIDGRNRFIACLKARVLPEFRQWSSQAGERSLTTYVISRNMKRRHLTVEQRAAAALKAAPFYEAEAKERQLAGGRTKEKITPASGERAPGERAPNTRERLAKDFDVPENKIRQVKQVYDAAPELLDEVASGRMKLRNAVQTVEAVGTPEVKPNHHDDVQDKKIPLLVERLCSMLEKELEQVPKEYGARFAEKVRHQLYYSHRWRKIGGETPDPTPAAPARELEAAPSCPATPTVGAPPIVYATPEPEVQEVTAEGAR